MGGLDLALVFQLINFFGLLISVGIGWGKLTQATKELGRRISILEDVDCMTVGEHDSFSQSCRESVLGRVHRVELDVDKINTHLEKIEEKRERASEEHKKALSEIRDNVVELKADLKNFLQGRGLQ